MILRVFILSVFALLHFSSLLYATPNLATSSIFTSEEIIYIKEKKQIAMCIDPNWMPFEKIENKKHIGMTSDFMKLFEKQIGIPIVMVPTRTWSESIEFAKNRKCDIFSLAMETKERKEYMDFTQPYINATLIITTRMNTLFITEVEDIIEKPLGITKGYAYIEILKAKYPNINLVEFESLTQGLDALREEKIFGYIDNLITTGYEIQQHYYGELKIAGKFDDKWELGIGVRNDEPLLLTIFDKTIKLLSQEDNNKILNKWISVKYDKGFDYSLFWKILLVLVIAMLFGLYRHFELKKLINELKKKDKELKELSIRDGLSQLYNRRHFDEIFTIEFDRAKRTKQSFIFAMIDIDFFKKYNDTYGHQAGDEAIRAVSKVLLNYTKRAGDYAFRIGGEEFAIISQSNDKEDYLQYLKNICKSVEELNIEHIKNSEHKHLTISIGSIEVINHNDITIDKLYKLTDEQLYHAKENGRNQVASTTL